jgi:hypothetical protein
MAEVVSLISNDASLSEGIDVYTVTGPDRHMQSPESQSVEFKVPANRYITQLTQECIGGPCGFSYSTKQNHPHEYDISYDLVDGNTKAIWTRKHTSHPVTYRISVYWKSLN